MLLGRPRQPVVPVGRRAGVGRAAGPAAEPPAVRRAAAAREIAAFPGAAGLVITVAGSPPRPKEEAMTHKKDSAHALQPAKAAHHKEVAEKVEEKAHPKASAVERAADPGVHPVDSLRGFNAAAKAGDKVLADYHLRNAEAAVARDGAWPTMAIDTDGLVAELEKTHAEIGARGDGLDWHPGYDRARVVARAIRWA